MLAICWRAKLNGPKRQSFESCVTKSKKMENERKKPAVEFQELEEVPRWRWMPKQTIVKSTGESTEGYHQGHPEIEGYQLSG